MLRILIRTLSVRNSAPLRNISVWSKSMQKLFEVHTVYPVSVTSFTMRSFQTNNVLFIKLYADNENLFAHKKMELLGNYNLTSNKFVKVDLISYSDYNQLLSTDWSQMEPDNLLESFKKLSVYASHHNIRISETIFDKFVDALTDNLINLTDSQLEDVFWNLKLWPETKSVFDRNFVEIWAALDDVILKRSLHWSNDKVLLFMDYACLLNLGKYMKYTWKGIWRASRVGAYLKPQEFVQFMYYAAIRRKTTVKMFPFQERFEAVIDQLSIEEIAIASMGFFKTKGPLRSYPLIKTIILRTIREIDNLNSVSLTAILKIIRYSGPNEGTVNELLDVLNDHIPRFSFLCSIHMALLWQKSKMSQHQILKTISDRFVHDQDLARMKDLERLALTFSSVNDQALTDEVYGTIVKQLRKPERQSEIMKHGRSYVNCILYLNSIKVTDADLISRALDEQFLHISYGPSAYTFGKEILSLDTTVQIELSSYTGNRINTKTFLRIAKRFMDFIPNEKESYPLSMPNKVIVDVKLLLQKDRGGADFARCLHILPYSRRADVVIANNQEGNPIPLSTLMDWDVMKVHFKPTNDTWIVFTISGKQDDSEVLTHIARMKNRQLATMGYIHIVIQIGEWLKAANSKNGQLLYLQNKILAATNKREVTSECEQACV